MIWWLIPVLLIPLFFFWNVVHEGAHALAAIAAGRKIVSFKPWPHKDPELGFAFGAMHFEGVNTTTILVMPYVADIVGYIGFMAAFWLLDYSVARTIFVLALACPIADTMMGIQARYRENGTSDLARIHWGWALPFLYLLLAYLLVFGATVVPWILGN